jgi:hypothetical protein
MAQILTISEALGLVAKYLPFFAQQREMRTTAETNAIRAICEAVDETRIHLLSLTGEGPESRRPSSELARLWRNAALEFRTIKPSLANRLRLKAEYWTDPQSGSPEQIRQARIRIDEVAETARDLLHG